MDNFCFAPGFSQDDLAAACRSLHLEVGRANWLLAMCLSPRDARPFAAFAGRAVLELFGCLTLEELSLRILSSPEPGAKFFLDLSQSELEDQVLHLGKSRFFIRPAGAEVTFLWRRVALRKDALFLVVALIDVPKASPGSEMEAWPGLADLELLVSPALQIQNLSFEDFAAGLARKFPGQNSLRFTWATDQEQKCCNLNPPLELVFGPFNDKFKGRDFLQTLVSHGVKIPGHIHQAMTSHRTFSEFEFFWPVPGADAAVPVRLGGFPCFDQNSSFTGYRGFGMIFLGQAIRTGAKQISLRQSGELFEEADGFLAVQSSEPEYGSVEKDDEQAIQFPAATNIVALYPARTTKKGEPRETQRDPVPSASPAEAAKAGLTPGEADAFREIALVLGVPDSIIDPAEGKGEVLAEPFPGEDGREIASCLDDRAAGIENLAAVLDVISVGVLVCRDQGGVLYANRALLDFLEFSDLEALADAQMGGPRILPDTLQLTVKLQNAERQELSFLARCTPIDWAGQDAFTLAIDLSPSLEQALAVEVKMRLYEREARELRTILDTATDGVAVIDGTGKILALNRSGEALFGYDQNEVSGKPFSMLVAPESRFRADEYLQGLKDDGVFSLLNDGREIFGLARQGGIIPLFITLGRISDGLQNGNGVQAIENEREETKYCALLRDLTHWKKVEQELEDARTQAERASALKSDFLAKVSHEIRTPLNAILGFAEVIIDERFGPLGNERYKDYLKDIHSSGALVMSIVNDLLDLSKIEAGKMDLEFVAVDANQIVADCVSIMQPQANRERIIVRLALSQNLPMVFADERSLRQIILNLLSNAVKFNEPGGQVIVATTLTESRQIIIRIRDTGSGMSDEDIKIALEPFRQLATSKSSRGTGLGLPLTKALVEANKAYFSIKSKKQEGTMVEITFPPARIFAE